MKRKLAIVVVLLACKFQSVFAAEHLTKAVASCEGGYTTTILDTGGDENTIQYFVVKDGVPVAQGMACRRNTTGQFEVFRLQILVYLL